jgi:hypothetical protein
MAEFHPTLYLFDFETSKITYPYFNKGVFKDESSGDYTDFKKVEEGTDYFWCHSISEILMGFKNNGLSINTFNEYDYSPYACFPNMKEKSKGKYVFGEFKYELPHVFLMEVIK